MALYIVTTHLNGHTEKAWPSYQTIADATGKSVKTIQRAVRDLEVTGWFEIQRGNGVGHNTEYRPSAASILWASEAREKTDRIVTLYRNEGGQTRPAWRSNEDGPMRRAVPLVFVAETQLQQISQWRNWLTFQGMPALEKLELRTMKCGKYGYTLPGHWPPDSSNPSALEWITIFRQRLDQIAKRGTRQTEVRRAS